MLPVWRLLVLASLHANVPLWVWLYGSCKRTCILSKIVACKASRWVYVCVDFRVLSEPKHAFY